MCRLIYTTKASRGWLRRRALLAETGPILAQDGARIVELQHGFLCHKSASEANRFVQCTCCLCRGFCSSSCGDSLQGSHFPDSLSLQSPGISHPTSRGISLRGWGSVFCLGRGLSFFFLRAMCPQAQLSCSTESWPSLVPLAAGTSPEFSLLDFTLLSVFSRSPNLGSQRQSWNCSN